MLARIRICRVSPSRRQSRGYHNEESSEERTEPMQEIKCPNCGEVFVVDESGYTQIVQQVRDKEFEKELTRREQDLAAKKESELEIARMKQQEDFNRLKKRRSFWRRRLRSSS